MPVSVSQVPTNTRIPLAYIQVDASAAGTGAYPQRAVIVARGAGVTGSTDNALTRLTNEADVITRFGDGSPIYQMAMAYWAQDPFGELWVYPQQATGTAYALTFTPAAAQLAQGATLKFTVNGVAYETEALGESPTATDLAALINRVPHLPFAASGNNSTRVMTLTARVGGTDIYFTVTDVKLGTTAQTLTANTPTGSIALDTTELARENYLDFIIAEQPTAAYLDGLKTYCDTAWDALQGRYGHAFAATTGAALTAAAAITAFSSRNNEHETVIAYNSATPNHITAAAVAGAAARELKADPARPLQTITVRSVRPAAQGTGFTDSDRNLLLNAKLSTLQANIGGDVFVERLITTYSTDANGNADNAWLDLTTPFTLMAVMRRWIGAIERNYPRAKLADNGTRLPAGTVVVTPDKIKALLVAEYKAMEDLGWVEGTQTFSNEIIVERDTDDRNRVNALLPANIVNQLRVFAALLKYKV